MPSPVSWARSATRAPGPSGMCSTLAGRRGTGRDPCRARALPRPCPGQGCRGPGRPRPAPPRRGGAAAGGVSGAARPRHLAELGVRETLASGRRGAARSARTGPRPSGGTAREEGLSGPSEIPSKIPPEMPSEITPGMPSETPSGLPPPPPPGLPRGAHGRDRGTVRRCPCRPSPWRDLVPLPPSRNAVPVPVVPRNAATALPHGAAGPERAVRPPGTGERPGTGGPPNGRPRPGARTGGVLRAVSRRVGPENWPGESARIGPAGWTGSVRMAQGASVHRWLAVPSQPQTPSAALWREAVRQPPSCPTTSYCPPAI